MINKELIDWTIERMIFSHKLFTHVVRDHTFVWENVRKMQSENGSTRSGSSWMRTHQPRPIFLLLLCSYTLGLWCIGQNASAQFRRADFSSESKRHKLRKYDQGWNEAKPREGDVANEWSRRRRQKGILEKCRSICGRDVSSVVAGTPTTTTT